MCSVPLPGMMILIKKNCSAENEKDLLKTLDEHSMQFQMIAGERELHISSLFSFMILNERFGYASTRADLV